MKKMITAVLSLVLTSAAIAQTDSTHVTADTTNMKIGDTRIILIDESPGSDSTGVELEDNGPSDKLELTHFAGIDLGVNVLLNASGGTDLDTNSNWMELDYTRSLSWRFNLVEEKIKLYKNYVGIMVGAGITYNSYGLRKNVQVITTDSTGTTAFEIDSKDRDFTKNKLRASYIHVPVMLEINTSEYLNKSFHISAGVTGGWNMGALTKQKWDDGDEKHVSKIKADYNFTPFTLDASVRIGYRNFTVFGHYGLTPLFEKDKGPEVYPVTVGIQIAPF
jgi:Outer membrane protein beta-barrel domain